MFYIFFVNIFKIDQNIYNNDLQLNKKFKSKYKMKYIDLLNQLLAKEGIVYKKRNIC